MATMTEADRLACWARMMKRELAPWSISKDELLAAIAAVDDAIETNEGALNNWFPAAFKTGATVQQKAAVMAYVFLDRYEVL